MSVHLKSALSRLLTVHGDLDAESRGEFDATGLDERMEALADAVVSAMQDIRDELKEQKQGKGKARKKR